MGRLEVQFQRLPQVGEGLFFRFTLAGDIEFEALRDVPIALTPDGRGERSLHELIVSHPRPLVGAEENRVLHFWCILKLGYAHVRRPVHGEDPLYRVGSSKRDLLGFPEKVKDGIGTALIVAQFGGKHPAAKPWKGEGSGILEVVDDHDGDTYRAVYTVRFKGAVYVLHCFQKKSRQGVRTPRPDVELVALRLRQARQDYEERYANHKC